MYLKINNGISGTPELWLSAESIEKWEFVARQLEKKTALRIRLLTMAKPKPCATNTATTFQIGAKLEYTFGNATGSVHNIERSTEMLRQLESVGIFDNTQGRAYLQLHLEQAYKNIGVLQENGRVMRESLLMGQYGSLKVESIWESNRLITIKFYGGNFNRKQ